MVLNAVAEALNIEDRLSLTLIDGEQLEDIRTVAAAAVARFATGAR